MREWAILSFRLIEIKRDHDHSSWQSAAGTMWSQSLTSQLQAFSKHNTTLYHQLPPHRLSPSHTHAHTMPITSGQEFYLLWQKGKLRQREQKQETETRWRRPGTLTHRIRVNQGSLILSRLLWRTCSPPHLAPVWHRTRKITVPVDGPYKSTHISHSTANCIFAQAR